MAGDCTDGLTSVRCRRTQMGTLGVLNLALSATEPVGSLAARRLPPPSVHGCTLGVSASQSEASPIASRTVSDWGGDDDSVPTGGDGGSALTPPDPPPPTAGTGPRHRRQPPRASGRVRNETVAQRQSALTRLIAAALHRLLGNRTGVEASTGSGMTAQVAGSSTSRARFLFCVVGPHAVDLAVLWFSPAGTVLCSCWGHTQNVALLSMTGCSSTCWHAAAFRGALDDLPADLTELRSHLQVKDEDAASYAVDISTPRGMASAAFDGVIYTPVVASTGRDIKCVAVGCRSAQRRCEHAVLVRDLERMAVKDKVDNEDDASDVSDDDGGRQGICDAAEDGDVNDDELVAVASQRQKRNLVSCSEEDRQSLMWSRTAEWAPTTMEPSALFSAPPSDRSGDAEPDPPPITLVQRMSELGLAFNPADVLFEKCCAVCGAAAPAGVELDKQAGVVYTDGNATAPLEVGFCSSCVSARGPELAPFPSDARFLSSQSLTFLFCSILPLSGSICLIMGLVVGYFR